MKMAAWRPQPTLQTIEIVFYKKYLRSRQAIPPVRDSVIIYRRIREQYVRKSKLPEISYAHRVKHTE